MGVVYKASDPTIGRLVAIKVLSLLPADTQEGARVREMFMREVRAAGRLTHPSIVAIHDAFEDPENQSSCIVMEFVQGRTLDQVLSTEAPLPLDKVLDILRQVAEGLDYAHREQVIHRDLKPANILMTDDGRVKITDFGIAKITARESTVRTAGVMGTPAYMSPEQVTGRELDARTDLFSLGVIAQVALTGERPFTGDTAALMFKIVYEDPVLPSKLNPRLGPGHDYLVLRLLAKDRNQRYSSAREFLDDLEDLRQGRPLRSQAAHPAAELRSGERTALFQTPILPPVRKEAPPPKRGTRWVAAVAALVVLGAALGLGMWSYRRRNTPQPQPQAMAPPPPPQAAAPATPSPAMADQKSAPRLEKETPPAGGGHAPTPTVHKTAAPKQQPVRPASAVPEATPAVLNSSAEISPPLPTPVVRAVQLQCTHSLKEATLTVTTGDKVIFQGKLKGKKKGGFLGLKGSYTGTFSKTVTLPADARDLSVRVVSADGAMDLNKTLTTLPPPDPTLTLLVEVGPDHLNVGWRPPARPGP